MQDQEVINLLNEGMFLDNHPVLRPPNTYGEAWNGTLISNNGNHYSFESLNGTVLNWTMPLHITGGSKFVPIGWFRHGNDLIVFSTDDKTGVGGPGEIGLVTFDNQGNGTYSAMYYHEDLLFTQKKMIEGYALLENDRYHRSYWTDNFNQPRTINLAASILTTTYASGSLVVGQQYMVLTDSIGSITHAATVYGPKQAAGNVFTATGTTYTSSGVVKVIKYLNPNILNYTPERTIGSIDFLSYATGNLFCGVKLYAYRLYTLDGYQSSWTFTSNPIHVGPDSPGVGYQQYQGDGASGLVNSGKAILLTISDIPSEFDKIQVAVVEMDGSYNIVRNSEVFWDSAISGTSMTITHEGQEDLSSFLVDDLTLASAVIVRCKTMSTLKQRQMIGNLTTRPEINPDLTGATVAPFTYEIPADDHGLTASQLDFTSAYCPASGVASGSIHVGGHYVVRGTGSITYNAVVYTVGQTFVGLSTVTTYTVTSGSPIVRGCIRIKQYTTFAGSPVYKIIDLMDEFFDYKSMASHMYLKGYFREETYRLGLLFLDKFGNPFFVRFLKDETIPSQSEATGAYKLLTYYAADDKATLSAVGLKISGIDISDIKDEISGVMVVRVPRDKTVLGQGMLWQNAQRFDASGTLDPNVIVPISTDDPAEDYHGDLSFSNIGEYTQGFRFGVLGPEFDFNLSDFNISLQSGDKLKAVADYSPLAVGGLHMQMQGLAQQVYSKYYTHHRYTPGTGSSGQPNITEIRGVGVYATTAVAGGYIHKNHDVAIANNHPGPIGGAPADLRLKTAGGGSRALTTVDEKDYYNGSNGDTGTGTNTSHSSRRLLVNYYRPNNNLYGGTSDVAKANNLYIPTGHYLKIDAALLSAIHDGAGGYVLNDMEVFGGDCFVQLYDRMNSVFDERYDTEYISEGSYSWGVIYPVESQLNMGLRESRHFCRDGMHNNANGVVFNYSGSRRDEIFTYNPAYSSENTSRKYAALPNDFVDVGRFPYMARYSEVKFLGEQIDSMRRFLINNFKNADALHGEINNLKVGFDRLFYWQDKGIGYFPVEERESTTGVLGQAVQLGVGGVMGRADTMDSFYGNQHQWSLIQAENRFLWVDMRRQAVVQMSYNGETQEASVIKGLQTYFQNIFLPAEADAVNIFDLDTPLMGFGIIGVYDPKKKTAYMTFKFSSTEYGAAGDLLRSRDFTIGLSAQAGKFIGFFNLVPGICIEHNERVYGVKEARQSIIGLTTYTVGMQVSKDGNNYVCIQAFTTSDPVAANQEPDYGGSVYWALIGSENQVHMFYEGDVCKYFGVVYPWIIDIPVRPAIGEEKSYDCAQAYGNGTPITDLICTTDTDQASDLNISSKNRNYSYNGGTWYFSYPLYKRKRMEGKYMIVRMMVKNYSTDITTSLNNVKRLVYLKTLFRNRK